MTGSTSASPRSRAITPEAPSIAAALKDLEFVWIGPGEQPPPHAWPFCVRWLHPRPRSAAVQYFENPAAFEPVEHHDGPPVVALFVAPAFDEVVALAMWLSQRSGRGRPSGKEWEAVAYYADNVRQGLLPEKVAPTVAPQSVYRAMMEERLPGDRAGFLEHAVWLVELLVEKLQEGHKLFEEDLVSDEPFLVEYIDVLQKDELYYRQDLLRAQRYLAVVPEQAPGGIAPAASPQDKPERLPLLAVRTPKATRFRMWAQRDPEAPGGEGWPLLVVQKPPTPGATAPGLADFQLTATVRSKAHLGFLAGPLTERERQVGGLAADRWYAGADYGGRMVASPEKGTRLTFDQVLEVLSAQLSLRPVEKRWTPLQRKLFAGFVVASWTLLLVLLWPGPRRALLSWIPGLWQPQNTVQPAPPPVDQGRGFSTRRAGAAGTDAEFLGRNDRALLVATERYRDRQWRNLKFPVAQAHGLRTALERRGFQVTLLENPTLAAFKKELTATTKGVWGPYDQFVLYFAGHGGVSTLGSGRLVLADSSGEDSDYLSLADLRGWLMSHTSRHVLLVLDSCFAGTISFDPPADLKGTPLENRGNGDIPFGVDEVTAKEKLDSPVRRYLTAVGRDVTPDDSHFTATIIEMLSTGDREYVTDLGLAARLEGVRPSPKYGRFEGDVEAGAMVFRPPR